MMRIYNNTKKRWEIKNITHCFGIVYFDSRYLEYGYFNYNPVNIPIYYRGDILFLDQKEHCKLPLYWCNSLGCYTTNKPEADNIITRSKHIFNYPIEKCYNFSKLNLIPKKIKLIPDVEFQYIKSFTFGLEYETSGGNIPWLSCLDTNLVPLYDGSIKGHEYVTFPLTWKDLGIVKSHLELLYNYTHYDEDCSLHIHFGGFPITYNKIESLCKCWYYFQEEFNKYIPKLSYFTEQYKSNGKAYNRPFPPIKSLSSFYTTFTNNNYCDESSFYLSNGFDIREERKWEVSGRYYNMNIMHLISGNSHKTVEFRFLRPTYNYFEIKWYILVLGAFLNYVICSEDKQDSKFTVSDVIYQTFPKDIADKLIVQGKKLYALHKVQMTYGDPAGINTFRKDLCLDKLYKFKL